jgi:hypothetical protein
MRSTRARDLLAYQWHPTSILPFSMIFSIAINLLYIPPACSHIPMYWPGSLAEPRLSPSGTCVPNNAESHGVTSDRQGRVYNGQAAKQPWLMEVFSELLTKISSQKREAAVWIAKHLVFEACRAWIYIALSPKANPRRYMFRGSPPPACYGYRFSPNQGGLKAWGLGCIGAA